MNVILFFINHPLKKWVIFLKLSILIFISGNISAQVNVIMNHNDLKRTGWNNKETILTQSNISNGNFGLVFSRDVDDEIYAQPLIVSNVSIGGGTHNIVIVATVNNTLYAFDADKVGASTPYWMVNLTYPNYRPVKNTDMTGACSDIGGYKDFSGNMGIVGTPAIDLNTNTLYVVARSVSKTVDSIFVQYLHAIDIRTGNEKPGSPVAITATYPGTGPSSVNGVLTFGQQRQNQRPGLLLLNGLVYICWASHCDWEPYQGWVMAYDATTLTQKYVFNAVPDGKLAGIWMSGQPPSVDDNGNIYLTTGNGTTGTFGNPNDTINRGSSLLKLSTSSGKIKVVDFFTPMNYQYLNDEDLDYGTDGVLLIPQTNLSLSGSKEGKLFMLDITKMGGTTTDNSNVLQILNVANSSISMTRHLHGSPVYFNDGNGNEYVYAWSEGSLLKQFPFDRSKMLFDTLNKKDGITVLPDGMPGAMLSLSSNGTMNNTGILWASHPINGDANMAVVPGVLQAFSANDITHELWNSNWSSKRDSIGRFAKFVPPTVANGKVYMATFSKKLKVYGLNPLPPSNCSSTLPSTWQSADIGYTNYAGDVCVNNGEYTITASGDDIWGTADAFHYVFQSVLSNKFDITIRVKSLSNTASSAKSGIMFRQNLDPGSPYVFLAISPDQTIIFQQRTGQSNSSQLIKDYAGNTTYWIKISATDNVYTSYVSTDGNSWTLIDSVTISLGANPYVGMAYTSNDNTTLGTSVIDNIVIKTSGPLLTNIINFTGKNINESYSEIKWTTTSELNIQNFEIQRSGINTDFETIGTVKGNGTTSESHDYSFNDTHPLNGTNYYRIKMIDINGNASYSSVVPVVFNLKKIEIFPNPANEKFFVRNNPNFADGNDITVKLMDLSGKVLYIQKATSVSDIVTVNIPKSISTGMYIVMVYNLKGEAQGDKIYILRK